MSAILCEVKQKEALTLCLRRHSHKLEYGKHSVRESSEDLWHLSKNTKKLFLCFLLRIVGVKDIKEFRLALVK